jgi:sensor histidine kinase YesM
VDRIGTGDLTTRIPYSNNDDVGDLAARVNEMAGQLEDLMKRISQEEKERQQQRLRALQMQLSPHFMYNALNTMRWMAIINRQDNIKTMIDALIQLMKNIAGPETEFTTLGRELNLLESYVFIQQMRYPGFSLAIEVPDELRGARINKFVLQNLVENSIVHGFSDRSEGGVIRVSAYTEAGTLYLVVSDNGVGFDPAEVATRADEEHVHTGLASIEERVSLVHGTQYGLELETTPGEGTSVTVRMPVELQEVEDQCASQS